MSTQVEEPLRIGKMLHDATRPFATESAARSWGHVLSTIILIGAALGSAAVAPWWPVRLGASLLGALLLVRGFILYHDYMHGSLLRESRLAKALFYTYGVLALTPPRSWRDSHNYHHANVGKLIESGTGSFPLLTTDMWCDATWGQRLAYRISRHPLTVLFAYVTVFIGSVCVSSLLRDPKRYWDSAVSLLAHAGLITALWLTLGFPVVFFAVLLPVALATAIGGYLFFAQHNYRDMHILPTDKWTYYEAALQSASYLELGRVMNWLTGNIGYHHVHHLNPLIPFYRLPEAMAAIPELQGPGVTKLRPKEIFDCFRLALWDPESGRLVTFREAEAA